MMHRSSRFSTLFLAANLAFLGACGGNTPGPKNGARVTYPREPFTSWEKQATSRLSAVDSRLATRFSHAPTVEEKLAANQDALVQGQPISLWQGGPDLLSVEYREAVVRRLINTPAETESEKDAAAYAGWKQLLSEELYRVERERELGPAAYGPLRAWVETFNPPAEKPGTDPSTNLDARTRDENDATLSKRLFLVSHSMMGNEKPFGRSILRFALASIERKLADLPYTKSRVELAKLYTAFEEADARSLPPQASANDLSRTVSVFAGDGGVSTASLALILPKAKAAVAKATADLPTAARDQAEQRAAALLREPCPSRTKMTPPERLLACGVLTNMAKGASLTPVERAATAIAAHDILILGAMAFELSRDPSVLRNLQDRSRFLSKTRYDDIAELLLATPETCVIGSLMIVRTLNVADASIWAKKALDLGLPPMSVIDPVTPPG
ncbi:MAG: hypothetical protein U0174_23460 [Polyangiaceae bacterium]